MFLFSVGFQLSFLAVTGIVYIFPRLYHLIYPDNKFIDKVWGLCCIAFAAQIATFPLSIYYFHQFPVYFFLSNLVVIPAAFVILSLGLSLLVFSFIAEFANVIAYILEISIWLVNKIIFMLEFLPYHIIKEIYITSFQTILLYIFLILFALFLNQKSYVALKCSFIAVLCFFIISVLQLKEQFDQQKLVIYNINNHSAIDFINRNNGSSFMSASLLKDSSKIDYHIVPYRLSRGLGQLELLTTKKGSSYETRDGIAFISWNGNKIIILEKPLEDNKVNFSKLETDYLLITNNCYSKLAPVVDRFNFRMLIFDSSNSYGIAQKLEEDARQRNLLFHSTRKAGALIIDF
jgi:competence protein ComEC